MSIEDILIESDIKDVNTEVLFVAGLYKNPEMLLDYGDIVVPKYDFAFETTNFLYNSIYEMYYHHVKGDLTEAKINIYMNQDEERKKKYASIKGYSYIKRIMELADLDDFEVYFNALKKYSLLRELDRKGFPAKKIYEKGNLGKLTPEDIIHSMEYKLNTIRTQIGGVQDSVILGRDMSEKVKQWKLKPDIGLEIPFQIINTLIRGLRKKKLTLTGMHSGCGKSRLTSVVACFLGIFLDVELLVAANEQDEDEWDAMVLSCVINNPCFHFQKGTRTLNELGQALIDYNIYDGIDETKIVTGALTDEESAVVDIAAKYIEENSKIHFLELSAFDEVTLKRQFKRHKIKGCQFIIYDTLKAPDHDWMSFVKTGDMLKEQAKELCIPFWGTFQLTDDSLFNEILNSQSIAQGKHLKHIADALMMFRPIFYDEYQKYIIYNPNDSFSGANDGKSPLNPYETYYIGFIDKNRGGRDKDRICLRVDKSRNMWIEEGYMVLSDDEKELKKLKKENKKIKEEIKNKELKKQLGRELGQSNG